MDTKLFDLQTQNEFYGDGTLDLRTYIKKNPQPINNSTLYSFEESDSSNWKNN